MSKLMQMIGASTLALTAGCAGLGRYDAAQTNTMKLSEGTHDTEFPAGRVDYMNAVFDGFALQPTDNVALMIQEGDSPIPRILSPGIVLDYRGIPFKNSTTDRVGNTITTTPNKELSYLVNVTFDNAGNVIIPNAESVQNSFFILSNQRNPNELRESDLGTFNSELFEELRNRDAYVTPDGIRLAPFPMEVLGKKTLVYLDTASMVPRERINRKDGQEIVSSGFNATGYAWFVGEEVPGSAPKIEGTVIGGEPISANSAEEKIGADFSFNPARFSSPIQRN